MTRVFALTNHKGGVGKSTTATNLAFGLVYLLRQMNAANARVLLSTRTAKPGSCLKCFDDLQ